MAGSRPITLAELNRMIDRTTSPRDRAFLLLAAAAGGRVNELRLARVSAVLTPRHTLTGSLILERRTTKGKAATRTTPLPLRTQRALSEWLNHHPRPIADAYLFPRNKEALTPMTARAFQLLVRAAALRAELAGKITPHSLRKFFGTRIYNGTGNDIAQAAAALGHRNPAATPAYLGLNDQHRDAAIFDIFHDPSEELFTLPPEPAALYPHADI